MRTNYKKIKPVGENFYNFNYQPTSWYRKQTIINRKIAWNNAPYCQYCQNNSFKKSIEHKICYLCGKSIFLNQKYVDDNDKSTQGWNIQHVDGNHNNNLQSNLVAVHRDCNAKAEQDDTTLAYNLHKKWTCNYHFANNLDTNVSYSNALILINKISLEIYKKEKIRNKIELQISELNQSRINSYIWPELKKLKKEKQNVIIQIQKLYSRINLIYKFIEQNYGN